MQILWIRLNSLDDIRKLLDIISRQEYGCYLEDGTSKVNVRRIMDIFSLDMTKKLKLYINGNSKEEEEKLKECIATTMGYVLCLEDHYDCEKKEKGKKEND